MPLIIRSRIVASHFDTFHNWVRRFSRWCSNEDQKDFILHRLSQLENGSYMDGRHLRLELNAQEKGRKTAIGTFWYITYALEKEEKVVRHTMIGILSDNTPVVQSYFRLAKPTPTPVELDCLNEK